MRNLSAPLLAAAALLAACGQPFPSARVEVPEIRIVPTAKDFPVPAALAVGGINPATLDPQYACTYMYAPPAQPQQPGRTCSGVGFDTDVGSEIPLYDQAGVTVDLRMTDLDLALTGKGNPGVDLRSITRAEIYLRDPVTGQPRKLASYTQGTGAPPTTIDVKGAPDLDLAPYLKSGKLAARVEVELESSPDPAHLPSTMSALFDAGFAAKVTVEYLKM